MYRKSKKLLVWCLVVSMVLTQMLFTNIALAATPNQGVDRYETAAKVAAQFVTSDNAVLAYGEDYPDALSAAPLAAALNAPILLTDKSGLNSYTKQALVDLKVKKVYVVGGEGVVPAAVVNEVAAMAGMQTPERVSGLDRVGTALAVAKKVEAVTGKAATDVFLATAEDGYFADALSVSSLAAATESPILLTAKDALDSNVASYIAGKKVYVLGGEGVVSAAVLSQANGERIGGQDRYETALNVLKAFDNFKYDVVYLATGENYPDALAGSVLAAKTNSPIVLLDQSVDTNTMAYLKTVVTASSKVSTLGGSSAVASAGSAVESAITGTVPPAPTTLQVQSVSAVDLNEVKVVFNQEMNETDAENTRNYKIGATQLAANDAAILQSDKKTVLVILGSANAMSQNQKAYFTVAAGMLNKAGDQTTKKLEQELTFTDVTTPTVTSVAASGNKKVVVTFSEPVLMTTLATGIKLDGATLASAGIDSGNITVKNIAGGGAGYKDDQAATNGGGGLYALTLEVPFNVALSAGSHTLTVPDGTSTDYTDAAGFRTVKADYSFTVADVTTAPSVVSIEGSNNGTVYVTFDRDMDTSTGTNGITNTANFKVNDVTVGGASMVSGSKSKVKLTANNVSKGANTVTIDKDVMDSYGNKLSTGTDDIRQTFNATEDLTKPEIVSVTLTGNAATGSKITVKFSEDVNGAYASNAANYELKDSDGTVVFNGTTNVPGIVNEVGTAANDDVWVITLTAGTSPLTGASYSLKLKNIVDLAATPNRMDEVIKTVNVADDVAPTVSAIYETTTANKIKVQYSEEMDLATVTNSANYYYALKNAATTFKALPTGTTIEQDTSKSVILTFPSSVTVQDNATGAATDITNLRVTNVKDAAGNLLSGGVFDAALLAAGSVAANQPTINSNSLKVEANSDKVWVTFETNQILSNVDIVTPEVTFAGQTPDSVTIAGKVVTLNYTNAGKMTAIKQAGSTAAAMLIVSATGAAAGGAAVNTVTADGVAITKYDSATGIHVYEDLAAPKLLTVAMGSDNTKVDLTFSEPIDNTIYGLYKDDFTVEDGAGLVTVNSVTQGANNRVLTFNLARAITAANFTVKAIADKIDIKDFATDGAETANLYVPSTTDKNGITAAIVPYVVTAVASDKTVVNAAIDADDTITITFSEAIKATTIDAALTAGGNITGTFAALIAKVGAFGTAFVVGGGADVAATSTLALSADGKTVTITAAGVTTGLGQVAPAGVFTPAAALTDTDSNAIKTTVTATMTGTF